MDIEKVTDIIKAVHKNLGPGDAHDDCVNKVYDKLLASGFKVEKEKPLPLLDGNKGIPDLTIVDGTNNLCHIEIKCKNHFDQGDNEQAEKFSKAEGGKVPVVLANMQPGKPEPNIKIY